MNIGTSTFQITFDLEHIQYIIFAFHKNRYKVYLVELGVVAEGSWLRGWGGGG